MSLYICLQVIFEHLTMPSAVKCLTCISSYNTVDGAHVLSPFYSFLIRKLKNREVVICPRPLGHQGEEPGCSPWFPGLGLCVSDPCCAAGLSLAGGAGSQQWSPESMQTGSTCYWCREFTIYLLIPMPLPVSTALTPSGGCSPTVGWCLRIPWPEPASVLDGYCSLSVQQWDRKAVAWFIGLGSPCPPPTCNPPIFVTPHILG